MDLSDYTSLSRGRIQRNRCTLAILYTKRQSLSVYIRLYTYNDIDRQQTLSTYMVSYTALAEKFDSYQKCMHIWIVHSKEATNTTSVSLFCVCSYETNIYR